MASNMDEEKTTKCRRIGQQVSLLAMAHALQHPKLDIPYFSHEPLDPQLYPGGKCVLLSAARRHVSLDGFKEFGSVWQT